MTKKLVWRDKETVDFDYKTLGEGFKLLEELRIRYGDEARFDLHGLPYDDSEYLFIQVQEEETDEEYNKRLAQELRDQEQRLKRELDEYKRLQAKFGYVPDDL
jgi:hypothetical protein